MRKVLEFLFLSVIVVISLSCNIDEEIASSYPKITLDSRTGVYSVKQGREIVIAPQYESAEGATYRWTMDGRLLGTEPTLRFMREECGEYYIRLTITTAVGSDSEELRIDVKELETPTVDINMADATVAVGYRKMLRATYRQTTLATKVVWSVNGTQVAEDLGYAFEATECGEYVITATASNDDGTDSKSITIKVVNIDEMPFAYTFDKTSYHTVVGRKLHIEPSFVSHDDIDYVWEVDGNYVGAWSADYTFLSDSAGEHTLRVTASKIVNPEQNKTPDVIVHEFSITVYEAGAYYRPRSGASAAEWVKIYEYTPAPGQFINELKTGGFDGTQTTPEAAVAYAEERMRKGNWVSLGGFGGYIIAGFDHSVDNSGDYDIAILGNSFDGSSEPGIVWVMQDENGNGLPDDTWYELAGSETGKAETSQQYAITYYRPSAPQMPVQWTDNLGQSGQIEYLKSFHSQDYYYPLWIEAESYTLTGTCLEPRNYDKSGNGTYWVNKHFDWGYVDNFSPIDRLPGENSGAEGNATNYFKIANAIDFELEPIDLDYIDFVKVQVGVNAQSGWLGELSTEVCGISDYNMTK